MEINPLATIPTATSTVTVAKAGIADNFDAFLRLLTTQLRHQNPLDPMDTNEFTAQLVAFSSVEQSIKTNDNLTKLLSLTAANRLTSVVSYIGKTVTATGATTELKGGSAQWSLTLEQTAPDANIIIKDQFGRTVTDKTATLQSGTHVFSWDGKLADGTTAPEGSYTISVTAKDASGNNIKLSTAITGVVKSVDLTGDEPVLTIGEAKVKFSNIRTVSDTPS